MKRFDRKTEYALLTVAVFAVITVLAWLLPLRPHNAADEKRELAKIPKLTAAALFSGDWFEDIDTWFSDTFTLRERWLGLSERVQTLYGHAKVGIYGSLHHADAVPVDPSPAPEPTATVSPWDDVDKEHWHGKVVNDDDFVSFGTVLQIDDACYEFFYFYREGFDNYAEAVERAAEVAGDKARVFSLLAPTAIGVMFDSDYLDKIDASHEDKVLDYTYAKLHRAKGVNCFDTLRWHNGEYLYFRTDHHWTAQAAYYAYREFCKTAGLTPADLNDFTEKTFDGYSGSLWSYAKRSNLLKPDCVHAFVPPGDIETVITTSEGKTYPIPLISDMTEADRSAKYLCFISGDNPFTEITNNSSQSTQNCLVIKDSFGNCFVPYLTQNYKHVYVVDYRSFREMKLGKLIDTYKISDIIFVNSIAVAPADVTTENIKKVVG